MRRTRRAVGTPTATATRSRFPDSGGADERGGSPGNAPTSTKANESIANTAAKRETQRG